MKLQSYDELKHSKYRLSLMLFLFLNIAVSLFCLLPCLNVQIPIFTLPAVLVAGFSTTLLLLCLIMPGLRFPVLTPVALLLGLLWAWHINQKYHLISAFDSSYLIISLLSVFFISAIALSDYLTAFCLHILPPVLTVLLLDKGQHLTTILFTITLPLIGFSLLHLMRRRFDHFTRQLIGQLYEEKQSFSALSMLDPLTGLYNRRGLQNKLDNLLAHDDGRLLTNVNASIAMKLAERIRQSVLELEIPHRSNTAVSTHVTVSAGIAPMAAHDFERAVANADRALYVAKNRGRNTILAWEALPARRQAISEPH